MTNKQLAELLRSLRKYRVQTFKNGKLEIYFSESGPKDIVIRAIGDGIQVDEASDEE